MQRLIKSVLIIVLLLVGLYPQGVVLAQQIGTVPVFADEFGGTNTIEDLPPLNSSSDPVPVAQIGTSTIDSSGLGEVVPVEQIGTSPIDFPSTEVVPVQQPIIVNPPAQVVVPAPAPVQTVSNNPQQNFSPSFSPSLNNAINIRNTLSQQQAQRQGQNAIANSRSTTGPITINAPSAPVSAPVPVVVQAAQPQVIQTVPVSQPVVVQTAAQPQVVQKTPVVVTQELPRTGPPLAAWALSGLIPFGLKLRRFGKDKEVNEGPMYLWQKREWDR